MIESRLSASLTCEQVNAWFKHMANLQEPNLINLSLSLEDS